WIACRLIDLRSGPGPKRSAVSASRGESRSSPRTSSPDGSRDAEGERTQNGGAPRRGRRGGDVRRLAARVRAALPRAARDARAGDEGRAGRLALPAAPAAHGAAVAAGALFPRALPDPARAQPDRRDLRDPLQRPARLGAHAGRDAL